MNDGLEAVEDEFIHYRLPELLGSVANRPNTNCCKITLKAVFVLSCLINLVVNKNAWAK